ncbi:hypothetical protein TNCV_4678771 [Trichonephila clavipes]|nr:hypothetical protein TNCV_4678771 [Trichonephila clavipes]
MCVIGPLLDLFHLITLKYQHFIQNSDGIGNLIEEVVDLARQILDGLVQELLDSHNQELTIDELIEMHEQKQDIEELESSDPVQSEDRMAVGDLTESLSFIEKGLQILEKVDSYEERIFSIKERIKKITGMLQKHLAREKKTDPADYLIDFMICPTYQNNFGLRFCICVI